MKKTITSKLKNQGKMALGLALSWSLLACEKTDRSFSMLSETDTFKQSSTFVQKKIDILWIVDNSGSMETSQRNLADNFQSFIKKFQDLNLDFRMAVQSTDAYKGKFLNQQTRRRFKDGAMTHSGVFVMDKNTPNLSDVFITNVRLGIQGSGDERALSSMEDTLTYTSNSDFRREDAFLSVIIISDEDDFSATTSASILENYSSPNIIPVSHYKDFLDGFAGAGNYSVNLIGTIDQACVTQLNNGQRLGVRHKEFANLVGGSMTSICDDFADSLTEISEKTIELASTFTLERAPIKESISVSIDGHTVPEDAKNGWTFDSATNVLAFHGAFIPQAGSDVKIIYDPLVAKQ